MSILAYVLELKAPTMWVVVMRRSMRTAMSLMFVFDYLDDIVDCIGEANFVVVASVVPSPSWTWGSSKGYYVNII